MEISNGVESMKVLTENNIKTLDGKSKDIVTDNIEKLRGIFPEVFCEDKVDFEKLQEVLGNYIEDKEERYRFEWNGKSQAIRIAQTQSSGTLRPCKEESKNWDTTQNLYIEGDNLEVLKLLQKSYQNKIKMIYIDPPYNTGNDFVYKDNYRDNISNYLEITGQVDKEGRKVGTNSEKNGRYHTEWLNMIYPRLRLAKNILSDDGVIFISIDDNEIYNLKKICDEIFGEQNFVANLVWEKKKKGSFLAKSITNIKEYILVYSKEKQKFNGLIGEINSSQETYPCVNASNKREIIKIPKGIVSKYKELNYKLKKGSIISATTMNLVLHSDLIIKDGILAEELIIEGNWRYTQELMHQYAVNGELYLTQDLYLRRIVNEPRYKTLKDLLPRVGKKEVEFNGKINIQDLFETGWGSNEDADEELRKLMEIQGLIDYPKPVQLIAKLIASYRENNITILDFFSGAATTANAVMKLNSEDGGERKFILIQLPEILESKSIAYKNNYKNICEIGKERIRRAGEKIVSENKNKKGIEDLDIGFKVLKLDSSNIKRWNPDYDNLEQSFDDMLDNFVPNRSEEDVVYEIMLKYGIDLTYPVEEKIINGKKVYSVGFGALIICLDNNITLDVIEGIVEVKKELSPEVCRIVFKDNGFANDSVKTNAIQILRRNSIKEIISI